MKHLRILLCDEDPQILSLFRCILEPEYAVVGLATDGQSLIRSAQILRPDIIVTDIDLPLMDGVEAIRTLRQTLPECRVLFHTSRSESEAVAAMSATGAVGYLLKGCSASLVPSIRAAVAQTAEAPFFSNA